MQEHGDVDEVTQGKDGCYYVAYANASGARQAVTGKTKAKTVRDQIELQCEPCDDPVENRRDKRVKLTGLLSVHTSKLLAVALAKDYGEVQEVYVNTEGYNAWAMVTFAKEESAYALVQDGSYSLAMFNLLAWPADANVRAGLNDWKPQCATLARLPPQTSKDAYLRDLMLGIGAVTWQLRRVGRTGVLPLVDVWFSSSELRDHANIGKKHV
ncbi:hypothetical protein RI367_001354 [Sorochytrium milnesiophthora]